MLPIRRLLAATDFSIAGFPAVVTAGEFAVHFGAELVLVHVLPPPPLTPVVTPERMATLPSATEIDKYERDSERQSREDLDRLVVEKLPPGLVCRTIVQVGQAAEAIVRLAEQEAADLIVIATHGRTGWRRLAFGSVAEKVVRTATRPVLVVPSPGQAESPSQ
ncbi:universal stress protein [candidate division WOR-3 bacterium]|nr:universal stress protein [candidate division WOR-3 bacterium]